MEEKLLGDVIRQLRDKADISLRELARKVAVSAPFMSDVELGRRYPSDKTLQQIAEELGTTFEYLKKFDNRGPAADIKRMMETDPRLGFAFRTAAERLKSGSLSPNQFLRQFKDDQGNEDSK
jgi:transcriptional regulator with XRE-family HTH domain